jgi:hypothetical protein
MSKRQRQVIVLYLVSILLSSLPVDRYCLVPENSAVERVENGLMFSCTYNEQQQWASERSGDGKGLFPGRS